MSRSRKTASASSTSFLAMFLLLCAGCLQTSVKGLTNGTPGSSAGNVAGSGSGHSTGGAVAGSGSGASAGATTSGGGSTGSGGASSGRTSGGTTGAASCAPNGSACDAGSECCSGDCNDVCSEGVGQGCSTYRDCSSLNCVDGQCACTQPQPGYNGTCGTDQDCCGRYPCTVSADNAGIQEGICCDDEGHSCQVDQDCCNQQCKNGQCECFPLGDTCDTRLFRCCAGLICNDGVCQHGPGGGCGSDGDCTTGNCENGSCGGCSENLVPCGSETECCTGLSCAVRFPENFSVATDGGAFCCAQPGSACGGGGPNGGCCGVCSDGGCACAGPTEICRTSAACCAGAACLLSAGGIDTRCCQLNGETCYSPDDCCSFYCGSDDKCACMPSGGGCGRAGYGSMACCSGVCGDGGACL